MDWLHYVLSSRTLSKPLSINQPTREANWKLQIGEEQVDRWLKKESAEIYNGQLKINGIKSHPNSEIASSQVC